MIPFLFFLVYFVGVTARIGAGARELYSSFARLCSFSPLLAFRVRALGCYCRFAGFPIQICYHTPLGTRDMAKFDFVLPSSSALCVEEIWVNWIGNM